MGRSFAINIENLENGVMVTPPPKSATSQQTINYNDYHNSSPNDNINFGTSVFCIINAVTNSDNQEFNTSVCRHL